MMPDANSRLYTEAQKFLGVSEVAGKKSNPLIKQWIKEAADWLNDDDSATAWCGCFRGHLGLVTATGVPLEHFRAKSWLKWGREVPLIRHDLWLPGDTAVLSRDGGGHVALIDRVQGEWVWLLGGNQRDKVCIARYLRSAVIGVRR